MLKLCIMFAFIKLGDPFKPLLAELINLVPIVREKTVQLTVLVDAHTHHMLGCRYINRVHSKSDKFMISRTQSSKNARRDLLWIMSLPPQIKRTGVNANLQQMSGKVTCVNPRCRAQLKRPETPFMKCPSCYTDFFVFCHEFPYKVFEHAQCTKCPNELYYFFCFKCNELMSFNKYRMGSVSTCKCGFSGCYVVCNHCHKPECFPPTQRYEGTAWKCEFCAKPFNFMSCDKCYYEVYRDHFYAGQSVTCENPRCRTNLQVKKCLGCKFVFVDSIGHQYCDPCYAEYVQNTHQSYIPPECNPVANPVRNMQTGYTQGNMGNQVMPLMPMGTMQFPLISPVISNNFHRSNSHNPQMHQGPNFTIQPQFSSMGSISLPPPPTLARHNTFTAGQNKPGPVYERAKQQLDTPVKSKEDSICKICLDKDAQYLNVNCFHMSACQGCVKSLNNQCPICRAKGTFRKVFK